MKKLATIILLYILSSFQLATYYHSSFNGKPTTSGEIYNENKLVCASNIHKFGTILKVTNIENKKSVKVKVIDRGSFKKVALDLSKKAFSKIENLDKGIVKVKIEVVR